MTFGTESLLLAAERFQAALLPAGSRGGARTGLRETLARGSAGLMLGGGRAVTVPRPGPGATRLPRQREVAEVPRHR